MTFDTIELYDEPIVLFTDVLCNIAKSCMPKTTAKQEKRCKPWFNTECKDAKKARKSALTSLKTNITSENLSNFRIARAKAGRACHENKRDSWQQYVSRLNSRRTLKSTCMLLLLYIFNKIWLMQDFPTSWETYIIIHVPKPGKVLSDPDSYRYIALASCLCKTMERMVNSRLTGYREHYMVITEFQNGFRRRKSTVDNLVTLETSIRDALVGRKHLVSIFLIWRRLVILAGNMVLY